LFEAGGGTLRTAPSEVVLACGAGTPARGERQSTTFAQATTAPEAAASPFEALANRRRAAAELAEGAVGARDWLAGQAPGNAWLLPEGPAVGATENVVVKHVPGHAVRLRINGQAVSPLNAAGVRTNPERTVAVAMWRGVTMDEGDNLLEADIVAGDGTVVETLSRTLRLSGQVVRAELVPEASVLVADGIHPPVVAVRMLDGSGKPVRAGVVGSFRVLPPYKADQAREQQQGRQLAGLEAHDPSWRVEGSDGIAYIALQPTTLTGEALLEFDFAADRGQSRRQQSRQQVRAWLKAEVRDWIVVGFAKGTIGHDTLTGNAQALDDAGHEAGLSTDGQLSLYAKGRVRGEWLLTLAYDSDKETDRLRRRNLLSAIDPNQFYLLYGDGTAQGYDASSIEKVYVKLERDQFYALFGDYATGLDGNVLSRYSRVLNGLKVEYRGPLFEVNAFAARTSQGLGHEELQGDGTSGLYRLSRRDILVNGERVRIEVRDRHNSALVVESRELARHLDYDIDYAGGTLFFREPVPSRDFDFNPVFIVVDYEPRGVGEEYLNAGGRAGVTLLDGRLQAGVTVVRDEDAAGRSTLGGLDATYAVGEGTELRAEVAASEGETGGVERSGSAYLVELEHHRERLDLLAYVRRSGEGFGLGQQAHSERGMFKAG